MKKLKTVFSVGKRKFVMAMFVCACFPDFLLALEKTEISTGLPLGIFPNFLLENKPEHQDAVLDIRIEGKVTDQGGMPIPGVTISVEGLSVGAVTDLEGSYSLVVPEGSTLIFSFIGYETQRVVVGVQNIVNVTLIEDISSLDEVVVVGYGVQSKRNVTSSVGSVSSEEIKNYPVQQMGQALQ